MVEATVLQMPQHLFAWLSDAAETGVVVAGCTAVIGLVVGGVAAFSKHMLRVFRTMDDLETYVIPHFAPPEPGHDDDDTIPARVKRLEAIAKELSPNGGSSMKDTLNRIDRQLHHLTNSIEGGKKP